MNIPLTAIPDGLETGFLAESISAEMPAIRIVKGTAWYPALVREEQQEAEDGTAQAVYRYFDVPVPCTGQDMSSHARFVRQSYAALRKFFYGPTEAQLEMQFKGTFTAHQRAVRMLFPKPEGANIRIFTPYEAIGAMKKAGMYDWAKNVFETDADVRIYWSSVQAIDLDNEDFLSFAHGLGVTDEQIKQLADIILEG